MNINYDKVADAIYFTLKKEEVYKSIRIDDLLVVDVAKSGNIVGMELLNASSKQGEELEKNIREGIPVNIISSTPVTA